MIGAPRSRRAHRLSAKIIRRRKLFCGLCRVRHTDGIGGGGETNWAAVWYYRDPAATNHSKTIIRKRADGRRRGRIDSRGTLSLPLSPNLRLIYSANFASPTLAPALLCLPWRSAPSGTLGAKWVPFITPLQYTQTAAELVGDDAEATAVVLWRGEIRTTGGVT